MLMPVGNMRRSSTSSSTLRNGRWIWSAGGVGIGKWSRSKLGRRASSTSGPTAPKTTWVLGEIPGFSAKSWWVGFWLWSFTACLNTGALLDLWGSLVQSAQKLTAKRFFHLSCKGIMLGIIFNNYLTPAIPLNHYISFVSFSLFVLLYFGVKQHVNALKAYIYFYESHITFRFTWKKHGRAIYKLSFSS